MAWGRSAAQVTLVTLVTLAGCGGGATTSAPTPWSYYVDFQSKDAAVAVDTLEISLFDASAGGCASLVSKRRGDEDLAPIAEAKAVPVCDVLDARAGVLTAAYAAVSVLVVAKKGDRPLLIGCGEQIAGPTQGDPAVVTLTNFDETVSIDPSPCATIAAHCADAC